MSFMAHSPSSADASRLFVTPQSPAQAASLELA